MNTITNSDGADSDSLATVYEKQRIYKQAEPLRIQILDGSRRVFGEKHPNTVDSLNNLIELHEAWGKPEKAEEWRAKLGHKEAAED